jgi:hypothetical protein
MVCGRNREFVGDLLRDLGHASVGRWLEVDDHPVKNTIPG